MAEVIQLVAGRPGESARRILTAQGGPLEASPRLRRFVAVYEDGQVLAAPAALDDPEFHTLRRQAASAGIRLREPEESSLDAVAAANAKVADVTEFATQARKTFLSILERAARARASDVMISRFENEAAVRFRVDGLMRDDRSLDPERATGISNAAFHLCSAGDSLASTIRPVRASITNRDALPAGVQGARLQFAPTTGGFVLILRLSYAGRFIHCRSLEEAGFHEPKASIIRSALQSSSGVFLVVGPTEHGKSTTLNLAIEEFARGYARPPNVVAVEDPPETLHLPFVQSFSINTSVESEEQAFESALLAALRLAPDGIKIGELRDRVSARTAYRAAGSGALVFSTVHAALATDVPFRLMDLGVERERAFDRLNILWVAQRLVPTVCRACSVPAEASSQPAHVALIRESAQLKLRLRQARFRGSGCGACNNSGYSGRVLVSEVVVPDEELLEIGLAPHTSRQSFRKAWLRRGGDPITIETYRLVTKGTVSLDAFVRNVTSLRALTFDAANAGSSP